MTDVYWPLRSGRQITSPFGPRLGEFHTGVDFGFPGGSAGEPVYAIQSGTVIHAGAAQGYGADSTGLAGWLVIDSSDDQGGGCLEYGHIVRLPEIEIGTKVAAGQQIAVINPNPTTNGGTPLAPIAPHLHVSDMPRGYDAKAKQDPMPRLRNALEPPSIKEKTVAAIGTEVILPYDHTIVPQERGHWCGPATAQTICNGLGLKLSESQIAAEVEEIENPGRGDDGDGTDYVGLLEIFLDRKFPQKRYTSVYMPNDPPTKDQKELLWRNLKRSIDAGAGVAANIVSPPTNRFKPARGSIPFNYPAWGTIWHYVALMGYYDDGNPANRAVWVADPGFSPFGGWVTFESLASLIPPKGYCFADVDPAPAPPPRPTDPAPPVLDPAVISRTELEWLAFIGDQTALTQVLTLAQAGDVRASRVLQQIEAVNPTALQQFITTATKG